MSTASASRAARSRVGEAHAGAALDDGAVEQALARAGIASSVLTFPPPPDWPKIVTLPGSPPKRSMLSRTHSQRGDHVERAGIARLGEALAADVGEVQMAEDVEAMVDGHDHDVVAPARLVPSSRGVLAEP